MNEEVRFLMGTGVPKNFEPGTFYFDSASGILRLCSNDDKNSVWECQFEPLTDFSQYTSLDGMEWDKIAQLSDIIADYGIGNNKVPKWLKVGSTKSVTINNINCTFAVLGFNHDTLSNGRKAGINFGLGGMTGNKCPVNSTMHGSTYINSTGRSTLGNLSSIDIPRDLRLVLAPVKKWSVISSHGKVETVDNLWLFSYSELFGDESDHSGIGKSAQFSAELSYAGKYEYFNQDTSNRKFGTSYYTRSICQAGCGDFIVVTAKGQPTDDLSDTTSRALRFGFCVSRIV